VSDVPGPARVRPRDRDQDVLGCTDVCVGHRGARRGGFESYGRGSRSSAG
jgi:hypothetical protein